jgi:hypothetical protein
MRSPVIYILAEERSGSTWVHNQLASRLNRKAAYIESHRDNSARLEMMKKNPDRYSDTSKVYRTHIFQVLDVLKTRALLIRTARRNTLDQMLSYFIEKKAQEKSGAWARFLPTYKIEDVLTDKITLTESEVSDYLATKQLRDKYWSKVDIGQTIYYEDLFDGVEVYGLGVTLQFDTPRPNKYQAASFFENYEDIKRLVE